MNYKVTIRDKNVTIEVPVEVEVVKEVIVNNTETVTVEVEDESFKILACDRLLYDDVSECVEEVEAEASALELALAEIKAELKKTIIKFAPNINTASKNIGGFSCAVLSD